MNSDKARWVRGMFGDIAHRYDFLNHFLSLGFDLHWRRVTVRRLGEAQPDRPPRILDLCCGTGDLALNLRRLGPVVGCDFCRPMLTLAQAKTAQARLQPHPVAWVEGDALRLPFADDTFDAVTVAFGIRNYADLDRGLAEIRRVLRRGGRAAILEFSHPVLPFFRPLFDFYFRNMLPRLGHWLSGRSGAYQYLHDSVQQFPEPDQLRARLAAAGFAACEFRRLTGGVVALHTGTRV